LSEVSIF
jgi:hypothetical protein